MFELHDDFEEPEDECPHDECDDEGTCFECGKAHCRPPREEIPGPQERA